MFRLEKVDCEFPRWLAAVVPDSDINPIILIWLNILIDLKAIVHIANPDVRAIPKDPITWFDPGIEIVMFHINPVVGRLVKVGIQQPTRASGFTKFVRNRNSILLKSTSQVYTIGQVLGEHDTC